jgi:hypothetical protein
MEDTLTGRCLSRIISRWTVVVLMTVGVLWGIHHRLTDLERMARTPAHIAVIPSTTIR